MPYDALSAADWYQTGTGAWVAIIRAVPDFDPEPLIGQPVTISGATRVVQEVISGVHLPAGVAPSDATGTTFGLRVS